MSYDVILCNPKMNLSSAFLFGLHNVKFLDVNVKTRNVFCIHVLVWCQKKIRFACALLRLFPDNIHVSQIHPNECVFFFG